MARGLGGEGGARGGRDPNAGGGKPGGGGTGNNGGGLDITAGIGMRRGTLAGMNAIGGQPGRPTGVTPGVSPKSGKNGAAGMSAALLAAKYPGAAKKKSKSFEASLDNLAKVGTLVGDVLGGPLGMAELAGETAVGTGPLSGPGGALNPFSGQGPDVPSVGAGFADNNAKDNQLAKPAERKPVQPEGVKKKKPVPPGFQLLEGAGGSLLGS